MESVCLQLIIEVIEFLSSPKSFFCSKDAMSGVNPSSSGITRSSFSAESSDGGDAEASSDGKEVMSDGDEEDNEEEDDDEDLEIPLSDLVKNMDDKSELGGTVPKSPIRIRLKVPPPPPTKTDRIEDENEDRKPPAIERLPSSASTSIQEVDCGGNNLSPTPPPNPPPPRKRSSGPTYPNLQPNRGPGQGSHPRHMSRNGAAAHRNRQIHVPPIGSPGLLMLPKYANMPEERGLRQADLIYIPNANGEDEDYVLPSTVFRESMIAGGYTAAVRSGSYYYRGSSTERTVGDMFDCDAGPRMYLHFPDLLPEALWNRRLGDAERARQARKEASDSRRLSSAGGSGGADLDLMFPSYDAFDSSLSLKAGPKGARSSYIYFTNTQRPLICEQFPGLKFTEQGVIMGERWRALTPEEKKPYEDMANADKERHARETRDYIEEFRQEMKASGQDNALNFSIATDGSKDDAGDELRTDTMDDDDVPMTKKDDGQILGPRLVDEVIIGLSKMLGDELNRRSVTVSIEPDAATSTTVTTDGVKSEEDSSVLESTPVILRLVSSDLTSEELPRFVSPVRHPQTHPCPNPHAPMSFLDMLPASLTATYPASYVAKRREYLLAVQAREDAIILMQEAKDDAEDAEEKYLGHVEAWERMLEYHKVHITKREDELKRERELFDAAVKEAGDMCIDKDKSADVVKISDGGDVEMDEAVDAVEGSTADDEVKEEKKVRPSTPTPEDPMDYMPSRPQRPGPPRIIPLPDIPIPPSPPVDAESMMLPMIDQKLVQHLDPSCFIPSMLGRYVGLLSNHIADPQFCGPLAPGIVGNTIGGGTGLATSYPGGGRGSGPVRGGASTWHSSLVSITGVKSSVNEKVVVADEITSSEAVATPADVTSSDPSLATAKLKRQPSGGDAAPCSSKNNKKQKKAPAFILTTGDRNTTALEVASGPADSDFPEGWIMKTYRRSGGETVGKTDKFWFSPGRNIRFRARKHAMSFLAVMKEPGVDGDEDKAAAIYKTRGLHF